MTTLMFGGLDARFLSNAIAVAVGLGLASVAVGGLALVAGRCKEEAMLSGAGALTKRESTDQFRNELMQRTGTVVILALLMLAGAVIAMVPAVTWLSSLPWPVWGLYG